MPTDIRRQSAMGHRYHASIIVTFHREGVLAHQTLLSLDRCRKEARAAGHAVQFVLSLDRPNQETIRVVRSFPGLADGDVVVEADFGDLGLSRNNAINFADGEWIGICDGDDYLSGNWIVRCLELSRATDRLCIWHPDLIVLFDGWNALSQQIGQDDPEFDVDAMLVVNPWNSCSFAHRDVYIACPYLVSRPGETGFGFEDWHWNCETLARGYRHLIADKTVHFVRRKLSGSLNQAHASTNALIHRTKLFDRVR